MASALRVNPTRMELTRIKKRLVTAKRGHKLLKDKRDEMVRQFILIIRENQALRKEVEEELSRALRNFAMARAVMDPQALEEALIEAACHADAIITSGGVSVGDADFVRALMSKLGEVAFWKIAMKPGRPMAFGRIGQAAGAWLFGLPGNPVAVMASFYQFVRPALLRMSGLPVAQTTLPVLRVPGGAPLKKGRGRTEFQRGTLYVENGVWQVRATGAQGSGILRSMAEANCFIVLGPESAGAQPGELVEVQLMDGLV